MHIKTKIYKLSEYHDLFGIGSDKYTRELGEMADMNYREWYDAYYSAHLDVYPSAKSLSEIWHNASQRKDTVQTGLITQSDATAFSLNSHPPGVGLELSGNGLRILDVIVCVNLDNLGVLGMCALEYNELDPHCTNIDTSKIYLTNLLVIPSARSHGIAAKLIQYCCEWLLDRQPELPRLYLNCQQKLIPYYIKRGWQLSDTATGLEDWYEMFTNTRN